MAELDNAEITRPHYTDLTAEDVKSLEWYPKTDIWDFSSSSVDVRLPGLDFSSPLSLVSRELPANTPPVESDNNIDTSCPGMDTQKPAKSGEPWNILNILEEDAGLELTSVTCHRRHDSGITISEPIDALIRRLDLAESEMMEITRYPGSLNQFRKAGFVMQCRSLLLDLESPFSSSSSVNVQELMDRMYRVLHQYRDIVDPLRICNVCTDTIRKKDFPKQVSASCEHEVNTCFSCLEQWISIQLDTRTYVQLKCVDCEANLTGRDVQVLTSEKIFQRYNALEMRVTLSSITDFHWCLNPQCTWGQIHYGGAKMECYVCKNKTCIRHGVAWHEGDSCARYDERRQRAVIENKACEDWKASTTRACPSCDAPIEKDGGCTHMNCLKCDAHFDWGDAPVYFAKESVWDRDLAMIESTSLPNKHHNQKPKSWKTVFRIFSCRQRYSYEKPVKVGVAVPWEIECGIPVHLST